MRARLAPNLVCGWGILNTSYDYDKVVCISLGIISMYLYVDNYIDVYNNHHNFVVELSLIFLYGIIANGFPKARGLCDEFFSKNSSTIGKQWESKL